jgi:hypothetical protein
MSWSRLRKRCRFPSPPRRSTPRVCHVVLAMLAVGLLAAGSSFAQPASPTLVWLGAHSTHVVRGRVVSLESSWTEDRTQIVTEVRIAVEEVLKGRAALEIRLIQPGGRVGDIAQRSAEGASFAQGEEVLVFAEPGEGTTLRLASVAEGKVGLRRDERGLWISPDSLRQVAPELELATDAEGRVRWGDFARAVRSALEEGGEPGLRRRQSPSLGSLAAAATPMAGQPLETEGFHVVEVNGGTFYRCPSERTPFLHWDLRQFPDCRVPYEINANHDRPAAIPAASFISEVHAAAGKWNAVAPAHISIFDNTQDSQCQPNQMDNRNCVSWLNNFAWGPNTVAWTSWWVDVASGRILESDVFLNPNWVWTVTPNPLPNPCPQVIGIQSAFIHELGHFVGLGHPQIFVNPACGNDDPNGVTKMYQSSTSLCQLKLHQADRDGINYLYTQDLGDLPDPPYPTLVHQNVNSGRTLSGVQLKIPNDGPSHLFGIYRDPDPAQPNFPRYQYEWLAFDDGAIDDHPQECEARPVDNFDDGVTFKFKCVNGQIQGLVTVLVSVKTSADVRGRVHTYNLNNRMYLNGWFDWNGDGDFADLLEYGIGQGAGSFAITAGGGYVFQILPPPNTPCDFASRFRLDWREDVGQVLAIDPGLLRERYAAQHGEVEDYPTPPQFPIPVYCHPKEVPVLFGGSGRTVSLLHLCHPPKVSSVTAIPAASEFPPAGMDCMHSTMTVGLDIDFDSFADEMVGLTGDVCVNRSDPFVGPDGLRVIETEMVSLDMVGTSELAGDLHVGLAGPSLGQIEQSPEAAAQGFDVSGEAPASTYFDVLFVVDSELYGSSGPVGPLRVEGEIGAVPPGEVIGEPPPPPPTEGDPGVLPAG